MRWSAAPQDAIMTHRAVTISSISGLRSLATTPSSSSWPAPVVHLHVSHADGALGLDPSGDAPAHWPQMRPRQLPGLQAECVMLRDDMVPGTSASDSPGEVTRLLRDARARDRALDRAELDRLVPLIYDDLRRLARRQLAREHGARSIHPTTLVHEAYLKLAGNAPQAADRAHLLAIAAHAMRQVLVDHARASGAAKRGAGWASTTLTDGISSTDLDPEALLALDDALERLDPRQRQVVECRFFAGMDDAEIAEALNVSDRTVRREWVKARAWLNRWLSEGSDA